MGYYSIVYYSIVLYVVMLVIGTGGGPSDLEADAGPAQDRPPPGRRWKIRQTI